MSALGVNLPVFPIISLLTLLPRYSMKRVFTASLVMTAALFVFSPKSASAQFQIGAAYGADTEFGINAGFYMPLAAVEGLAVGVDGTYFLPMSEEASGFEIDTTWWEANLNGRYGFVAEESMGVYGLAGLQYASVSVETNVPGFDDATESEIGINVGVGADFMVGFGGLFLEARYAIGGFEQFGVYGGLRF